MDLSPIQFQQNPRDLLNCQHLLVDNDRNAARIVSMLHDNLVTVDVVKLVAANRARDLFVIAGMPSRTQRTTLS